MCDRIGICHSHTRSSYGPIDARAATLPTDPTPRGVGTPPARREHPLGSERAAHLSR